MGHPRESVRCDFSSDAVQRYSRQLLLKGWGVTAQKRVCAAKVLVIGAGGLGCPAAMYLAGAGVGKIGIVDDDDVERSNLHRQIGHGDERVGEAKATSLRRSCLHLNPSIEVEAYIQRFTVDDALEIVKNYDVIVDATDNVASKYLINDVAVLAKKPLISGASLGFEGQVSVYNFEDGPCYRCVFPQPPPLHLVGDCNNGGVLGPVPGVIGTLQAIEALKVIAQQSSLPPLRQSLLVFDAGSMASRTVRLRGRQPDCSVCGSKATESEAGDLLRRLVDAMPQKSCSASSKSPADVSVHHYAKLQHNSVHHILLDVRERHQFDICSLPGAINVPLQSIKNFELDEDESSETPIFVICRRGFASAAAVRQLVSLPQYSGRIFNIQGGLTAWARDVDPNFPMY